MSLLPISLLEPRLPPKQNYSHRDTLKIIFLRLPVVDLERMHLGCHQWLCILNNMAKEVVRQQWPHLYAEYDRPRQNWIPLYCRHRRALENIAAGRFQLIRLQFDDYPQGYGMNLGKLIVRTHQEGMLEVLSLADGKVYKSWKYNGSHHPCLGRIFGDCTKGVQVWNMRTGKNLVNLSGKKAFQLARYENATIAVDQNSDPTRLYVYDDECQILRQLLPPSGFNQLNVSISRFKKGQTTNFPSRELAFIWTVSRGDKVEDQVVAIYQLSGSEESVRPSSTYRLSLSFDPVHPIRSVQHHEGYTLVWIEPDVEYANTKIRGWAIFDKNNKRINFSDDILSVVWMPGKIIFASIQYSGYQYLHILDTATGLIEKPLYAHFVRNTQYDVSWIYAIDARHVAYLARGDAECVELAVVNVCNMQKVNFKIPGISPGDFDQFVPVFFDGEKLVWTSSHTTPQLCVLDFTVRNPTEPQVKKMVKAANYKLAEKPWRGDRYRWEPRAVTWSRGVFKYWWISAAIVLLGFIYFRRTFGAIGPYRDAFGNGELGAMRQ